MPGTTATADMPAGREAPAIGIYVVSHHQPAHTMPHDVLIRGGMLLPKCRLCADVRFSLRAAMSQPIEENEFFLDDGERSPR
jgi:hypothetical protein